MKWPGPPAICTKTDRFCWWGLCILPVDKSVLMWYNIYRVKGGVQEGHSAHNWDVGAVRNRSPHHKLNSQLSVGHQVRLRSQCGKLSATLSGQLLNQKIISKGVDKSLRVWYNIYSEREIWNLPYGDWMIIQSHGQLVKKKNFLKTTWQTTKDVV